MNNKKINATVAEEATNETINAAEDAASINKKQEEMKKKEKVVQTTKLAKINGEYVEITPAYTDYSMEPSWLQREVLREIGTQQIAPCCLQFCKARSFLERRYPTL